jgi:hypothetical protein
MANSKVVYTAITAWYDRLKPPAVIDEDLDYVVFTDDPHLTPVPPWRPVFIESGKRNPRVTARWYKLLPHLHLGEYVSSLWIDGAFEIIGSLAPLIDEFAGGGKIGLLRHPERDCIYQEAATVKEFGYERPAIVDLQMACYRAFGYPERQGLNLSGVIFRQHHDPQIRRAMADWWHQIEMFSQRDQLSLNYVLWKHGIASREVPGEQGVVPWLRHHDHPDCRAHLGREDSPDELAWLRMAAADAWEARRFLERDLRRQTNSLRNATDRDRRHFRDFPL